MGSEEVRDQPFSELWIAPGNVLQADKKLVFISSISEGDQLPHQKITKVREGELEGELRGRRGGRGGEGRGELSNTGGGGEGEGEGRVEGRVE